MSDKVNCLILDDEPVARKILQNYCAHLSMLHVVASCQNALEAKAIIQSEHIDILFLDINMPVLSGLSFLTLLRNHPAVIFTTAYKEYALDAFDLSACDYLLKPFSLERFIVAVDKALHRLQKYPVSENGSADKITPQTDEYIFLKTDKKIYKILFEELLYAEANGNYIKIVTLQGSIMVGMTFSNFEALLPGELFIRIHRSFIINKSAITHIEGNRAFINNTNIPIGSNYKDNFLKRLGL